jgi:peroxiredoxin
VRFVAIICDGTDVASASNLVSSQKLDYPVLQDQYGIVAGRYGVKVLPMTFVINPDGVVEAVGISRDDLETQLDPLLTDLLAP